MNLITEYERRLEQRVGSGELCPITQQAYMTDAAKVLEALVGMIPVAVVQAYVEEWGARSDYKTVIRDLAAIAQERKQRLEELRQARSAT